MFRLSDILAKTPVVIPVVNQLPPPNVNAAVNKSFWSKVASQVALTTQWSWYSGSPSWWNDALYLASNPDVAAAVRAGRYYNGWAHWASAGYKQARASLPANKWIILGAMNNPPKQPASRPSSHIASGIHGLGTWYDPFTWGSSDSADNSAAAADPNQVAAMAGDVRYACQLYQWTRQSRNWLYNKRAVFQEAYSNDNTLSAAADGIVKCTEALNNLVALENQLEPEMQKIDTAARQNDPSWRRPADFGFRWDGWEGDQHNMPAQPPASTPVPEGSDGLSGSGWLHGVAVAAVILGAVLIFTGVGALLGALLIAGAIIAELTYATAQTPAGQEAISKIGSGISNAITSVGILSPALILIGIWLFTSGTKGKRK